MTNDYMDLKWEDRPDADTPHFRAWSDFPRAQDVAVWKSTKHASLDGNFTIQDLEQVIAKMKEVQS